MNKGLPGSSGRAAHTQPGDAGDMCLICVAGRLAALAEGLAGGEYGDDENGCQAEPAAQDNGEKAFHGRISYVRGIGVVFLGATSRISIPLTQIWPASI